MKQPAHKGKPLPKRLQKVIHLTHPNLSSIWLDSGDVMRLLHCSKRTLQTLRNCGLPYYDVHQRLYLYKLDEIQAYIEERKTILYERNDHD